MHAKCSDMMNALWGDPCMVWKLLLCMHVMLEKSFEHEKCRDLRMNNVGDCNGQASGSKPSK